MALTKRVVLRSLPLAGLATACCLLVYFVMQQVWRHDANDPQIQLARDTAARLTAGQTPADVLPPGPPVDISRSLAPFLMVLDTNGGVVRTSGRLRGDVRTVPPGVLAQVRRDGEEAVTWQPERGVRIASVVVDYPGGFVLAGRSLAESERRTAKVRTLILLAWLGMIVGLLSLTTVSEALA